MKDDHQASRSSPPPPDQASPKPPARLKLWRSEDLFGAAANEIAILHDGEEYRLRITKNNKLILTK